MAEFGTSLKDVVRCRVCGRTLLAGERSIGFFTDRGEGPFDVCELCAPSAPNFGLRATPSSPDELALRVRRGRRWLPRSMRHRLAWRTPPVGTAAIPVALAAFNGSTHAHMLAGLFKTLGEPRASVVPRSPTDREVILTVAWEIVWYQFRIAPECIEHCRGTHLTELPVRWQRWNCTIALDGRVVPPQPERGAELAKQGARP